MFSKSTETTIPAVRNRCRSERVLLLEVGYGKGCMEHYFVTVIQELFR